MKSSSISPAEKEVKKNLDTFLLFKIFLWVLIFFVVISSNVLAIFEQIGQDEGVFLVIASGLKNYLLPYADFF
jgi:Ni,Fe-hydrogenase I cytochrome b subunit